MGGKFTLSIAFFSFMVGFSHAAQEEGFLLKDGETIVFLGDSITQAASKPEGYISLFDLFCGVNGYEVKSINAGISGHKSNDMLARLETDVLSHKPDWVSISCGVNDVWHQFSQARSGVPLPDYKKNMTEIVDRCLQSGAKVLLLTPSPIHEKPDNPENRMLNEYIASLKDLAQEKKVLLCDLNQAYQQMYSQKLNEDNLLTTDGVHMKPRGYRLWATEMLKCLGARPQEIRRAQQRWELVDNL